MVSPGSVVRPGDPMIEIVGKYRFVVAWFPVSRLYRLHVGGAVTVSTGGASLPGKIAKVSVIADALPASVRPTQGFIAGTQVVGKAVSARCFAFWNAVLSAEAQGTYH